MAKLSLTFGDLSDYDWRDIVPVVFEDSAHANRPDCSTTGGLVCGFANRTVLEGQIVKINRVVWRSWKLNRKATISNGAEVQSLAADEDMTFRLRLLELFLRSWRSVGS